MHFHYYVWNHKINNLSTDKMGYAEKKSGVWGSAEPRVGKVGGGG